MPDSVVAKVAALLELLRVRTTFHRPENRGLGACDGILGHLRVQLLGKEVP